MKETGSPPSGRRDVATAEAPFAPATPRAFHPQWIGRRRNSPRSGRSTAKSREAPPFPPQLSLPSPLPPPEAASACMPDQPRTSGTASAPPPQAYPTTLPLPPPEAAFVCSPSTAFAGERAGVRGAREGSAPVGVSVGPNSDWDLFGPSRMSHRSHSSHSSHFSLAFLTLSVFSRYSSLCPLNTLRFAKTLFAPCPCPNRW